MCPPPVVEHAGSRIRRVRHDVEDREAVVLLRHDIQRQEAEAALVLRQQCLDRRHQRRGCIGPRARAFCRDHPCRAGVVPCDGEAEDVSGGVGPFPEHHAATLRRQRNETCEDVALRCRRPVDAEGLVTPGEDDPAAGAPLHRCDPHALRDAHESQDVRGRLPEVLGVGAQSHDLQAVAGPRQRAVDRRGMRGDARHRTVGDDPAAQPRPLRVEGLARVVVALGDALGIRLPPRALHERRQRLPCTMRTDDVGHPGRAVLRPVARERAHPRVAARAVKPWRRMTRRPTAFGTRSASARAFSIDSIDQTSSTTGTEASPFSAGASASSRVFTPRLL